MPLAVAVRREFDSGVRTRGEVYFRSGVVRVTHGDASSVSAQVKGGERYMVTLHLLDHELIVDCSCRYFATVGPCKHVWATVLAADADGYAQPAPGCGNIMVTPAHDIDNEDVLDDGFDDGDSESGVRPSPPRSNIIRLRDHEVRRASIPLWKQLVTGVREAQRHEQQAEQKNWPSEGKLLYVVDVAATAPGYGLAVEVLCQPRKLDGSLGTPKPRSLGRSQMAALSDPEDRQIVAMLLGAIGQSSQSGYYYGYEPRSSTFVLTQGLQDALLPLLCRTGRCLFRTSPNGALATLHLDDGPPWEFRLEVRPSADGREYVARGALWRGEERKDLSEPALLVAGGWVFWAERVARLIDHGAFQWIALLRESREFRVPLAQGDEFLVQLLAVEPLPPLDLPEALRYEDVRGMPLPRLKVRKSKYDVMRDKVCGELSFDYGGTIIAADEPGRGVFLAQQRRMLVRDKAAEAAAVLRLKQLGFRRSSYDTAPELTASKLPRVVHTLIQESWHVEAEGKLYRRAGKLAMSVSSGIDWFELDASVEFEGMTVALPALLAALKKGENIVRLDDGSFGLLPEEWLKRHGILVGSGTVHDDHLRFSRAQAGLLDVLLASQPEATCDATFSRVREELRRFEAVAPAEAPPTFAGQLRDYQREGLGWLLFLQRFGFGGCLADDMGLGKTIQVLALLDSRREMRAGGQAVGTSLVVAPRSLIFNWKQEAARFTPQLRVLDHTGTERAKDSFEHFGEYDLILTTYGTLRRDAARLKDYQFDYVVLDEAQTVKNANTEAAKAARLMRGNHRLGLSGTPIENHLGELWSIFEFLNPGMLGAASVFKLATSSERNPDEHTRTLLSRALRPFILRRTKAQVAKDLPEKTEQTLYCELDGVQRKLYDELRRHYREALLSRVRRDGINKAKIQILEALLRLRQAACHPGLIDKNRTAESSAKLEALMPQLAEVLEEDHKALVFSQFTSLLAIVRERLDAAKIPYEYLDGHTRDREAKVTRFQNDPECRLFLVSLKAGGLGLNLTAAEYVFLLDPWWNPAVEAQAIDRAHRIGQTRAVFAYRLIAKNTVEEKVLELQQTKRELADAIINADHSLIRSLSREDLELLLG